MAGVMKGTLMSFLKEMAFSELQTPQNSTDFWNVKENSTDLWNVETLQARRKLFIALFHVHNAQLLGLRTALSKRALRFGSLSGFVLYWPATLRVWQLLCAPRLAKGVVYIHVASHGKPSYGLQRQ